MTAATHDGRPAGLRPTLKRIAKRILRWHIPAGGLARPVFRLLYGFHVVLREGGIWAARFFWYEPLFRSQCEAVGPGLFMEQIPYLSGRGRIVLGEGVRLSGKSGIAFGRRLATEPEFSVGNHTFIGHQCCFTVGKSVRIGDHCLLAGGVMVRDFDGHPLDASRRRANEPSPPEDVRPVTIGNDVWVGARAMILKGVTIGDRSIVAAGAVVTKDVPPDVVVAGNPARIVKHLTGDGPSPRDS